MSLSSDFNEMIEKSDFIIAEMAANLLEELIKRTPVDIGTLKASWDMQKVGDGWLLTNNMNYASFIFNGRREVMGKMFGSLQLPDGVYPIIQQFNNQLQKRLNNLKG